MIGIVENRQWEKHVSRFVEPINSPTQERFMIDEKSGAKPNRLANSIAYVPQSPIFWINLYLITLDLMLAQIRSI